MEFCYLPEFENAYIDINNGHQPYHYDYLDVMGRFDAKSESCRCCRWCVAALSLLVAAVLGGDFLKNKVELEKSESDRLRSYRLSERS